MSKRIVLAGAFGNLGADVLKELINKDYEVIACDLKEREISGIDKAKYQFRAIDVTDPATLNGICEGADAIISTVGLTGASAKFTNYDIDLNGNINLLNEALKANVKYFTYISVIKTDSDPNVAILDAKAKFEKALKESGINYIIHRPTGYFYDIAKVFMPMIEKGKVSLLGRKDVHANIVSTEDFATFIVAHMFDENKQYDVGGKETYSYSELASLFFAAANKKCVIKRVPAFLFDLIAKKARKENNGKEAVIKFGKWTMTTDLVADTIVGDMSLKEYIYSRYKKD